MVPDATDVLVSPFSLVTEFCEFFASCCSDWEDVVPQSFSFSKKRAHCCTRTQEDEVDSPQIKVLPLSRRRMRPPTPMQSSYSSFEEEQERFVVEVQMWSARDRTVIARTKQYLERTHSVKVEVEEMEDLLDVDDVDVDFRRILKESKR